VYLAYSFLVNGIQFILDNFKGKITVVGTVANHGRTTQKMRVSSSAQNSYDWLMYKYLEEKFKDKINFLIPEGEFAYYDVFDYKIRQIHGHQMKYGGGIGGVHVPVNRAIAQWNSGSIKADLTLLGHFHQFKQDDKWVMNGSLIGYNQYAERIRAGYADPCQQLIMMSSNRGFQGALPIFVK